MTANVESVPSHTMRKPHITPAGPPLHAISETLIKSLATSLEKALSRRAKFISSCCTATQVWRASLHQNTFPGDKHSTGKTKNRHEPEGPL